MSPARSLPAGTWFKPREQFKLRGRTWITDGFVALAVDANVASAPQDRPEKVEQLLAGCVQQVGDMQEHRGWIYAGDAVYSAYYIALIRECFPGCEWRKAAGRMAAIAAFVDGEPVGAAMCARMGADEEPPEPPRCPACNGSGFAEECSTCDGSGEVECHACGHDTECEDCDGEGGEGQCQACGGSKKWRAPEVRS